jgi:hypothetical protein
MRDLVVINMSRAEEKFWTSETGSDKWMEKKLLSEEFRNLYTSSHTTATRNANTIFVGIPTEKGYLARSRCKWNILKWVRETGCTCVYSIHLAQ